MTRKERYDYVLKYFREQMPEVQTELEFSSVFQLLVAVILSAQCTDKRINQVTPELFRHFPDAKTMATAEVEDVLEYVKSVSYPNSKAEHLVKMARMLVERHEGEVPQDMNLLLDLPGVGRKTANVIQSVAFGKSSMAVDTHVFRVSHRLGLVTKKDNTPYKVEQMLVKIYPRKIFHGHIIGYCFTGGMCVPPESHIVRNVTLMVSALLPPFHHPTMELALSPDGIIDF